MIIKDGDLVLELARLDDKELRWMVQSADDLFSMQEVSLYPESTPTEMVFRIEHGKDLVGEIRFKSLRWFNRKAELSIIIKKEFQKQGFGKSALKLIVDYAFNKMNLHRLEAEVIETNFPSIKLVEQLGFKLEGKLREAKYTEGGYVDILRYGILRTEHKQ